MTPYLEDADLTIYVGDSREVLADVPDGTVDLVVTSPPFFGLRDYGTGRWEGGDSDCAHLAAAVGGVRTSGDHFRSTADEARRTIQYSGTCGRCGARRLDEQIGMEDTPEDWVASLVEVFEQCRRALKPTGCLVVECGDSYASNVPYYAPDSINSTAAVSRDKRTRPGLTGTLKSKDLIGAPFELALALRAAGWYWRGLYVWNKPNPMPESVTDRCTTAHSYVLHMAKSERYYWDPVAILEEAASSDGPTTKTRSVRPGVDVNGGSQGNGTMTWPRGTRNARSVWTIATEPTGMGICPTCLHYWTRNAPAEHCGGRVVKHYAAFPQALAEKAILAGTSERGCCPGCGAPWERVVEKGAPELAANTWSANGAADQDEEAAPSSSLKHVREVRTLGWEPTCSCAAGEPVAPVVLDPFAGSGTAAVVARRLGRSSVAVELNPAYAEMIARRLAQQSLLA